jgi:hypothetical protein
MPVFKTTLNILKIVDADELHDRNWLDSDKLQLPPGGPDNPKLKWDYSRELRVEDVDIWEVLYEASGGIGVYAAWLPYAEFYMVTTGWIPKTINDRIIETYYGPNSQKQVYARATALGIPLTVNTMWVDEEDTWLYTYPTHLDNKTIILP